jgi:hypothetical protein
MFTAADIQNRVRQRPFAPFRVVTSAGQTLDVTRPDLIMIGRRDLIIGATSTDDPTTYEQVTRVAIMHVTALQDLPSGAGQTGNGQQ